MTVYNEHGVLVDFDKYPAVQVPNHRMPLDREAFVPG